MRLLDFEGARRHVRRARVLMLTCGIAAASLLGVAAPAGAAPTSWGATTYLQHGEVAAGNGVVAVSRYLVGGDRLVLATIDGTELWAADVPEGLRRGVVIDDSRVYAGLDDSSEVVALDRSTGAEVWRTSLAGGEGPGAADVYVTGIKAGLVYVRMGSSPLRVAALDPDTGVQSWASTASGDVVDATDAASVITDRTRLSRVDHATGATTVLEENLGLAHDAVAFALVDSSTAQVAQVTGEDGAIPLPVPDAAAGERLVMLARDGIVHDGIAYVALPGSRMAAYDLQTLQRRWISDSSDWLGDPVTVLLDGGAEPLVVTAQLSVVDGATGQLLWSGDDSYTVTPAGIGDGHAFAAAQTSGTSTGFSQVTVFAPAPSCPVAGTNVSASHRGVTIADLGCTSSNGEAVQVDVVEDSSPAWRSVTGTSSGELRLDPGSDTTTAGFSDILRVTATDARGTTVPFRVHVYYTNHYPRCEGVFAMQARSTATSRLLECDSAPGDPLTYSIADGADPAWGTVDVDAAGNVTATITSDAHGPFEFAVGATDRDGDSTTARFTLTPDDVPMCRDAAFEAYAGHVTSVELDCVGGLGQVRVVDEVVGDFAVSDATLEGGAPTAVFASIDEALYADEPRVIRVVDEAGTQSMVTVSATILSRVDCGGATTHANLHGLGPFTLDPGCVLRGGGEQPASYRVIEAVILPDGVRPPEVDVETGGFRIFRGHARGSVSFIFEAYDPDGVSVYRNMFSVNYSKLADCTRAPGTARLLPGQGMRLEPTCFSTELEASKTAWVAAQVDPGLELQSVLTRRENIGTKDKPVWKRSKVWQVRVLRSIRPGGHTVRVQLHLDGARHLDWNVRIVVPRTSYFLRGWGKVGNTHLRCGTTYRNACPIVGRQTFGPFRRATIRHLLRGQNYVGPVRWRSIPTTRRVEVLTSRGWVRTSTIRQRMSLTTRTGTYVVLGGRRGSLIRVVSTAPGNWWLRPRRTVDYFRLW